MPDLSTILLFVTASAALLVVPGPTLALVIARSLAQGRRVALPLVLGVGLGDLVAASLSLVGAGALLAASATAFTAVKWAGAAYLIWLGVRLFRTEPTPIDAGIALGTADAKAAFRDGFLVTVFNPKGILFFVAFVPQFIDAGRDYLPQAAFFVGTFTILAMVNGIAYALGADALRRATGRTSVLRAMNRAGGAVIAGGRRCGAVRAAAGALTPVRFSSITHPARMSSTDVTNLQAAFGTVTEHWAPRVVGRVNDAYVKVAKVRGELMWHAHADEDELFLVVDGRLRIEYEGGRSVELGPGDFHVVPRGVMHNPVAEQECSIEEQLGAATSG